MDNFSHSLAGVVTAELALALRRRGTASLPALLPRVAWVVGAAANNLPDVDFVYTGITGGVIGTVLHHRGHTHTVIFAVLLAPLVLLIPWIWGRRRGVSWSRADWLTFAGLSLLGTLLHFTFDGTNDYGVHPFWPASNAWFYGDTIFIIEPWFWVCTVPLFLVTLGGRAARVLWALPVALVLVVAVAVPFVPGSVAITLWTMAAGLGVASRRLSRDARVALMVFLSGFAVVTFALTGRAARAAVRAAVARELPENVLWEVTSIPGPSNPFCWMGFAVMTSPGGDYVVRRYLAATAPGSWPAQECRPVTTGEPLTAPWRRLESGGSEVRWLEEYRTPVERLRRLAREDCHARALFGFLRVPFLTDEGVLGDLRYDREPGLGFTEIQLGDRGPCPRLLPPWTPPLGELLLIESS